MEIFHIGHNQRKLVSIFYPGNKHVTRRTGVVICSPIGHEYIRFYQAISVLAKKLANEGYATFKFDYYGCGDSYGDEKELDVESSKSDLKLVIQEMREGCDVEDICLIGIRYGSFLSLISQEEFNINSLVLWNPIFSGVDYLNEISQNDKSLFDGSFASARKRAEFECLGFTYSANLILSLGNFSLKNIQTQSIKNILIMADKDWLAQNRIADFDFFNNCNLKLVMNTVSKFWHKQKGDQAKAMVPRHDIGQIILWLEELHERRDHRN